jgi:uncharacterized protein (UPF0332 family)
MSYHNDLVEQAEHLARMDKKRPKQANLRRAVSSAYYALFHLLVSEASGYWKLEHQRATFARAFEHGKMKNACKKCGSSNNQLMSVTTTFVELQQYRHLADYDNSRSWTRVDVLDHISTVKRAFHAWEQIKNLPESQDFLLSLLVQERK